MKAARCPRAAAGESVTQVCGRTANLRGSPGKGPEAAQRRAPRRAPPAQRPQRLQPQRRSGPAPRARRPELAGSVAEQASRRRQLQDLGRTEAGAGTHGASPADPRWEPAARGRRGAGPPGQEQAAAQAGGGQAAGPRVTSGLRRLCFRSLLFPALRAAAPLPF
ncbi:hypothetical protein J1605_015265 [Eschrichtius robustus]|uniref:Uncharacterized protein n=1 Tax=Eschrichtius robustus TaxID=9764 RepID=A0AB34GCV3_ESCRO|nr:hypothetical protein J1605_015265 [Eschrichtius robustus]